VNISIGGIILTKNEGINLRRCIDSLQWCQDIVVLDSGSTDETRELAAALGARVFTHIQQPKFIIAEQRNWALKNCDIQTEWVIFVDADETIPAELAAEINRVCNDPHNLYNAFELTPRYLFWGKWLKLTQGYPNWHSRLVKRGEVTFEGGVWEHFIESAKVGRINTPYDHFANSKGFADWLDRHMRYSDWEAQKVVQFLETGESDALATNRKLRLRIFAAKFYMLRPIARFFQMYILRLGFLEGWESFFFCLLYAMYEFMTVTKIIEIKRSKLGLPL
jgi:glycosyltransferase involved in cell wall biosynthesis